MQVWVSEGQLPGIGTDTQLPNVSFLFTAVARTWGTMNNSFENVYAESFSFLYSCINAANTIIKFAERSTNVNWIGGGSTETENKNRVLAEAKAIQTSLGLPSADLLMGRCTTEPSRNHSDSNIKTDWNEHLLKR